MPRFIIHHVTKYTYPEAVRDSANQVMLFPVKDDNQEVQSQQLNITGDPFVEIFTDYYGNEAGSFMNIAPHTELSIDSTIAIVTKPRIFPADDIAIEEQWSHLYQIRHVVPFIDFLKQENFLALDEVKKIADAGFYKSVSVYVAVQQLNTYVHARAGEPSIRLIVCGKKGSKAGARLLPGLVLHGEDGAFTPLAEALHRGTTSLDLK